MPTIPFVYKAELYNEAYERVMVCTTISDCSWQFLRQGGCGSASLTVRCAFGDMDFVDYWHSVKIFINTETTNEWQHVYTGRIVDREPVWSDKPCCKLTCAGYSSQLADIMLGYEETLEYTGGTAWHDIIKALVSTLIVQKTDILYYEILVKSSSNVATGVYTVKGSAIDCLNDLAQLAGNYEWGVTKDRYFYFVPAYTGKQVFAAGKNVSSLSVMDRNGSIKNRIIMENEVGAATAYDAEDDLLFEPEALARTATYLVGHNSATFLIAQTFEKQNNFISKVRIRAQRAGAASGNLISDGDMEAANTSAWTADTGATITKGTSFNHSGSRSMICETRGGKNGFSQDLSAYSAGQYQVEFWSWVSRGSIRAEVLANGSVYNVLGNTDELKHETDSGGYQKHVFSFTAPDSLTSAKLRFVSTGLWQSAFRIDDVKVTKGSIDLMCGLYDADDPGENLLGTARQIEISSTDLENYEIPLNYYGKDDGIDNYRIMFFPNNWPGDDNFYIGLACNSSAGIPGGGSFEQYDNLGDLLSTTTGSCVCLDVICNESVDLYGPHEEVQAPAAQYGDRQTWVNYYLSGKSRPFKSITTSLFGLRMVPDVVVPVSGLGSIGVVGISDTVTALSLPIEQIDYSIKENGISAKVQSGQKLPNLAYQFKNFEQKIKSRSGY